MNKKEIIERLYKAGHINFDEMLMLAKEPEAEAQPLQPVYPHPIYPYPFITSNSGAATIENKSFSGTVTPTSN